MTHVIKIVMERADLIMDMLLEPLSTVVVLPTVMTAETPDHVKVMLELMIHVEVVQD